MDLFQKFSWGMREVLEELVCQFISRADLVEYRKSHTAALKNKNK